MVILVIMNPSHFTSRFFWDFTCNFYNLFLLFCFEGFRAFCGIKFCTIFNCSRRRWLSQSNQYPWGCFKNISHEDKERRCISAGYQIGVERLTLLESVGRRYGFLTELLFLMCFYFPVLFVGRLNCSASVPFPIDYKRVVAYYSIGFRVIVCFIHTPTNNVRVLSNEKLIDFLIELCRFYIISEVLCPLNFKLNTETFLCWQGGCHAGELEGPPAIIGSLNPEQKQELVARCASNGGDLILFAAGPAPCVHKTLDALRTYLAESLDLIDKVFFLFYHSLGIICLFQPT